MKRIITLILSLCLFLSISSFVFAETNEYYDNVLWIKSTAAEINTMYDNGNKLIVVYYRTSCGNCKYLGDVLFNPWMNNYSQIIYGVNVDSEGINKWARDAAGGGAVSLPLVVFINNKELISIQGASEENIKLLNNTFIGFNKETPINTVTPGVKVKSDSVYKHSIVTVVAEGTDVPEGYCLTFYDAEGNLVKKGNQYFVKYSFPDEMSKATFLNVVIVKDDGIPYKNSEGNEIRQRIEITIKNGFFENIFAFFKWLFKSNEITIAP